MFQSNLLPILYNAVSTSLTKTVLKLLNRNACLFFMDDLISTSEKCFPFIKILGFGKGRSEEELNQKTMVDDP
jgi:hypothetical protein